MLPLTAILFQDKTKYHLGTEVAYLMTVTWWRLQIAGIEHTSGLAASCFVKVIAAEFYPGVLSPVSEANVCAYVAPHYRAVMVGLESRYSRNIMSHMQEQISHR